MTVFVVPGEGGIAQAVPPWLPVQAEDVRLDANARELIELRSQIVPIPASLTLEP